MLSTQHADSVESVRTSGSQNVHNPTAGKWHHLRSDIAVMTPRASPSSSPRTGSALRNDSTGHHHHHHHHHDQRASDGSLSEPLLENKERKVRRQQFHRMRHQVLLHPHQSLEKLTPYAHLCLNVSAARDLLTLHEHGILIQHDHASLPHEHSPFVQVFVNDVWRGTSAWRSRTKDPSWDFRISLEIWSPLSVVQVRVVHRNTHHHHDIMGFMEFCVADLEANELVSGWFELRRRDKLQNKAPWRLRRHERRRDDHFDDDEFESSSPQYSANHHRNGHARNGHAQIDGYEACQKATASTGKSLPMERKWSRPRFLRFGCRGPAPKLDIAEMSSKVESYQANGGAVDGQALDDASSQHTNAGEIHIAMQLRAPDTLDDSDLEKQDWPVQRSDEWFAFCFDRPEFKEYESQAVGTCILTLHQDVWDLYFLMHDCICGRLGSVLHYLGSWQCCPLTFVFLLWWWLLCFWTWYVLFMIPLWFALLLYLLRQEKWFKAMAMNASTAPLNHEGFGEIRRRRRPTLLALWLDRLLSSMRGKVHQHHEKHKYEFADSLCKDEHAVLDFHELVDTLLKQHWIKWHSGARTCPRGHALKFRGLSIGNKWQAPLPGETWKCQRRGGCPNNVRHASCFYVGRFHCPHCNFDLCETCAHHGKSVPKYMKFPVFFYPHFALRIFDHAEAIAEMCHHLAAAVFHHAALPFSSDEVGTRAAQRFYLGLMLAFAGTLCLACRTKHVHSMARAAVATARQQVYRHRRRTGGCATYWAFFAPDV